MYQFKRDSGLEILWHVDPWIMKEFQDAGVQSQNNTWWNIEMMLFQKN